MARGYRGRLRAQAQRPLRVAARCACCSCCPSSTSAARSGCCTSTCSCCSRSAPRTSSSTAARSASPCRSSTPCCSTCSCAALAAGLRPRERPRPARAARAARRAGARARAARRLPRGAQRRRLERDRRRLRRRDRRRPDRRRRRALRRRASREDVEKGDTYGPVNYLLYVPVRAGACPGAGAGTTCPPRTARRSPSTCSTIAGCCCSAARCGPAAPGRGWAWRSPTPGRRTRTRRSRSRPTPTTRWWPLACVAALLALTLRRSAVGARRGASRSARRRSSLRWRSRPLFAGGAPPRLRWLVARRGRWRWRRGCRSSPTAACASSTTARSATRPAAARRSASGARSTSLAWLQTAVKAAAVRSRCWSRSSRAAGRAQVAALGAAVLIALQLPVTHWFYLYVVWFVPFVLVALFARVSRRRRVGARPVAARRGAPSPA